MYSNTRFHQLLEALPRAFVDRMSTHLQADRYDKSFKPYDHLLTLLYGQISGARSLRELETAFNAQAAHHYHLGTKPIRRSTLSDANQRRNPTLFKSVTEYLMGRVHRKQRQELAELTYLLDSTPIQLTGRGFDWAEVGATYRNQGLKVHLMLEQHQHNPVYLNITSPNVNDIVDAHQIRLEAGAVYVFDKGYCDYGWWQQIEEAGATFVTRLKRNAAVDVVKSSPCQGGVILADEEITFRHRSNRSHHQNRLYGKTLRRIQVHRDDKSALILLTNDRGSSAEDIAELYRKRWQIELFFKWIKQNLKLKRFLGRSENAVILQIYTAIISYLLIWLYRKRWRGGTVSLHLLLVELRETLFNRLPTDQQRVYRRRRQEQANLIRKNQYALSF